MINIKETEKDIQPYSFPKLMINKNGLIVLFESMRAGTIIKNREDDHSSIIGEHITNWDHEQFTDYHGELRLQNSEKQGAKVYPYLATINDRVPSTFLIFGVNKGVILDPGLTPFKTGDYFCKLDNKKLKHCVGFVRISNKLIKEWP